MNESKNDALLYEAVPAVAGLNKVPGFDPRKLLHREISEATGEEVLKLELKYKKLWFRLAHPEGRIHLNALRITDQLAVIEAQVYLDRSDPKPISSFTAQRSSADTPSGQYVQEAEREAMNEALDNAGFGLQFCDASLSESDRFGTKAPLHQGQPPVQPTAAPQAAAPVKQAVPAAAPALSHTAIRQEAVQPATKAAPAPAAAQAPTSRVAEETEPAPQPAVSVQQAAPVVSAPVLPEPAVRQEPAPSPVKENASIPAAVQEPAAELEPTPQAAIVNDSPVRAEAPALNSAAAPMQTGAAEFHAAEEQAGELPTGTAAPVQTTGVRYTPDMPVEEISALMTLEEARNLVVDVGICKGWTMAQVAERRAASLKWYLYCDQIKDNIVKAAADIMMQHLPEQKKAS